MTASVGLMYQGQKDVHTFIMGLMTASVLDAAQLLLQASRELLYSRTVSSETETETQVVLCCVKLAAFLSCRSFYSSTEGNRGLVVLLPLRLDPSDSRHPTRLDQTNPRIYKAGN